MERRYWLIALVIVVGAITLLAYRPDDDPRIPVDRPRASDRIVELPAPVDEGTVATVELDAPPPVAAQPAGAEADASLIRRFEAERVDPAWAPVATARVTERVGAMIADAGGTLEAVECRRTACRVQVGFADAARRPDAVGAVMSSLGDARMTALIERVTERRVTLLVVP